MCQTEEESGILISSEVVDVNICGREEEKGGQASGLKMGQLTLSMGSAGVEVCFFVQRATIPSKRVLFTFTNTTHAITMLVILYD
jgi:hypothetical protein